MVNPPLPAAVNHFLFYNRQDWVRVLWDTTRKASAVLNAGEPIN